MGVLIKGGTVMLIFEAAVLGAAMLMYVGAEWTAEDTLDDK